MRRRAPAALLLAWLSAACGGGGSGGADPATFAGPAAPGSTPSTDPANPAASPTGGGAGSGSGDIAAGNEAPGSMIPLGEPSMPGSTPPAGAPLEDPLPRSTPEAEGLSSAGVLALVSALASGQAGEIHSLMLLRHGKVVAEGWWAPYAPEDLHVLYSVTKSFNATAVGFAVAEGLLGIDDLLVPHFADMAPATVDPELSAMTIRHLLTMSTGHTTDSIDAMRQRSDGQWTRSFLEGDVPNPPGTNFLYNSGAAYMLGSLVQRVTGSTVEEYLRPRLFEPLGITHELWGQSQERVNLADGGLSVRTEDLAKFGQLYLAGGVWKGEQLLPEGWASAATAMQVSTGNNDNNWGYGYGFQFWRSQVGYRADGSLGQFAFVLPDEDMVLAITSGTNDTNGVMNIVWQNLPAIMGDGSTVEDPAGLGALRERLAGLALAMPAGQASSPLAADVSGRRYVVTGTSSLGMTALALDFSGASPVLTIEDGDGVHALTVGSGQWARQRTGYRKHINELFDTPEQGVAVSGAWSAENTFVARLVFNETPYSMTTTFGFEGEQVRVSSTYNVRWGTPSEPEITATRE
jgi:CubicO group peptidase (beta-lactamase class C family)